MSARILVAEDEESLAALLDYNLRKEGYEVEVVEDGEFALLRLMEEPPDLLILDWMLPNLSGVEICRRARSRSETRETPIVMLTARDAEEDRVRGLDAGADDYIAKPFSVTELLARVRAVLRRSNPAAMADVLRFADLTLDRVTHRARRGDRDLKLGPTEFRLLETLMRRPGRVFSRERLLSLVWGAETEIEARTVDVHIGRLRKALNEPGERDPLRTVRAAGYALDETYEGVGP